MVWPSDGAELPTGRGERLMDAEFNHPDRASAPQRAGSGISLTM